MAASSAAASAASTPPPQRRLVQQALAARGSSPSRRTRTPRALPYQACAGRASAVSEPSAPLGWWVGGCAARARRSLPAKPCLSVRSPSSDAARPGGAVGGEWGGVRSVAEHQRARRRGASRARVGWPGASARLRRWAARLEGSAEPCRARAQPRRERSEHSGEHAARQRRSIGSAPRARVGAGPRTAAKRALVRRVASSASERPPARCERARGASGARKRGWGEPAAAPDVVVRSLAAY
ncbi:hypothetical protein HRbin27_00353 [bacterium HR27]|nr:hypothetical protein HRbin27_00353 [bacterium HR27]